MTILIEYESFANEWDGLEDAELITSGIWKGRNLDHQCEMNWEQRTAAYVDRMEQLDQQREDLRFSPPESSIPFYARDNDRID